MMAVCVQLLCKRLTPPSHRNAQPHTNAHKCTETTKPATILVRGSGGKNTPPATCFLQKREMSIYHLCRGHVWCSTGNFSQRRPFRHVPGACGGKRRIPPFSGAGLIFPMA